MALPRSRIGDPRGAVHTRFVSESGRTDPHYIQGAVVPLHEEEGLGILMAKPPNQKASISE